MNSYPFTVERYSQTFPAQRTHPTEPSPQSHPNQDDLEAEVGVGVAVPDDTQEAEEE